MSIVIIGTGLAGYTTAREFRKHDTDTSLTLVTADSGRAYSKPMLSTGYRKQQTPHDLVQSSPEEMARQLDATVLTDTRVEAILPDEGEVHLRDGKSIAFDKLVLALGADPVAPPIRGDAVDRIFQINDLDQYERFRKVGDHAGRVLVIGGGLIGCEFANDLREADRQVDLVFPEPLPLPLLLPDQSAEALRAALEDLGVVIHSERTVDRVDADGEQLTAKLSDGSTLQADTVLAAVGLRPRTELAEAAGLSVGKAIRVDRSLATSHPNVYALGDCAEVEGWVLPYVAPLTNAARALAKTLAGETTDVRYPVMPVNVKTSCCQVVAWPPAGGAEGVWQFDGEAPDIKAEFRGDGGTLLGFALTGKRIRERMALQKELPDLF
ncbi:rubredoxin-NAD+ reductase [Natronocella acetinitrilica]|uniref:Rubredoxin-NAD+ reductase n=1 Tax=Natronocella acetinitrilica TaxID=414046 RepID=A0AAE3GAI7_9GAMM|nr:FAD-dependent oxidoreductase [Natronocella acetinitrilica]MCP1676752.1 rubredoxin-NAD+ reductase [Natronocella acetinitrilica]